MKTRKLLIWSLVIGASIIFAPRAVRFLGVKAKNGAKAIEKRFFPPSVREYPAVDRPPKILRDEFGDSITIELSMTEQSEEIFFSTNVDCHWSLNFYGEGFWVTNAYRDLRIKNGDHLLTAAPFRVVGTYPGQKITFTVTRVLSAVK